MAARQTLGPEGGRCSRAAQVGGRGSAAWRRRRRIRAAKVERGGRSGAAGVGGGGRSGAARVGGRCRRVGRSESEEGGHLANRRHIGAA